MDSKPPTTATAPVPKKPDRDFLNHLETYLAKRDGVDKLLKISRYTAKILISSSALPETHPLTRRLKSFESSVGLSRKAFRLGKFVQDLNALRNDAWHLDSKTEIAVALIAYGGEGLYYFVEQFIWLIKSGLISDKHARVLGKVSAWSEFVGYIGSITLKVRDLNRLREEEKCLVRDLNWLREEDKCLVSSFEVSSLKLRKVREKLLMKRVSVVQDFADAFMALADIRNGMERVFAPVLVASAGLLSALISTHKNWASC